MCRVWCVSRVSLKHTEVIKLKILREKKVYCNIVRNTINYCKIVSNTALKKNSTTELVVN